jgi:hypothetical protein
MKKLWLLILSTFCLFLVGCWWQTQEEIDVDLAKKEVKNFLKAPSTAIFYDIEYIEAKYTEASRVNLSVDSENSFGGMWRNDFKCMIKNNVATCTTIGE